MSGSPAPTASPHRACPVCGGTDTRVLYPDTLGTALPRLDYGFCAEHGRTYEIQQCRGCTHRFAVVTVADLWKTYRDLVDPAYLERAEERAATFKKLVNRIRRFVPSGRLLDIGCATGDFLQCASSHFQAEGVELSRWSSTIATSRGFKVHTARLSEIEGEGAFDVATLWGVIGLFEHPQTELTQMARLVKPGGIVAVWTGDMGSITARLLGRRYWYVMGQYLQLFTRRSLCLLFEQHGFVTAWVGTYPFTSTLRLLGNSLGRYPGVGAAARALFRGTPLGRLTVTLLLPGEMFAVFRRV